MIDKVDPQDRRVTGEPRERLTLFIASYVHAASEHHHHRHRLSWSSAVASWYYDAGETACGFHAHYGVANLSLPCGTHVSFEYEGRRVETIVDDRGPYVSGRTWDLNQNTAEALNFTGVGVVRYALH